MPKKTSQKKKVTTTPTPTNKVLFSAIQKELEKNIDKKYKEDSKKFFKEDIRLLGVRNPKVRIIARTYFSHVKQKPKEEIYMIIEQLLKKGYQEYTFIAFDWAFRIRKQYTANDFPLLEKWLKENVSNWASCDDFCTHALGFFLILFPEYIPHTQKYWTTSRNRWVRRAASVVLILPGRKTDIINETLKTATILLHDEDDLVRKGTGWMLKEASKKHPDEIYKFVKRHKKTMPRTTLRYAIEKFPKTKRMRLMK